MPFGSSPPFSILIIAQWTYLRNSKDFREEIFEWNDFIASWKRFRMFLSIVEHFCPMNNLLILNCMIYIEYVTSQAKLTSSNVAIYKIFGWNALEKYFQT